MPRLKGKVLKTKSYDILGAGFPMIYALGQDVRRAHWASSLELSSQVNVPLQDFREYFDALRYGMGFVYDKVEKAMQRYPLNCTTPVLEVDHAAKVYYICLQCSMHDFDLIVGWPDIYQVEAHIRNTHPHQHRILWKCKSPGCERLFKENYQLRNHKDKVHADAPKIMDA